MSWQDAWTVVMATLGCFFVTVSTIGLLRLPDLHTRIHALTKADTLGLGLLVVALLPWAGTVAASAKLLLVWVLGMVSASLISHLLARDVAPILLAGQTEEEPPAPGTGG